MGSSQTKQINELKEKQITEWRSKFLLYDIDENGTLDHDEFHICASLTWCSKNEKKIVQ